MVPLGRTIRYVPRGCSKGKIALMDRYVPLPPLPARISRLNELAYDLWYLRHRSLTLDTVICLKTLPRMALSRGAR